MFYFCETLRGNVGVSACHVLRPLVSRDGAVLLVLMQERSFLGMMTASSTSSSEWIPFTHTPHLKMYIHKAGVSPLDDNREVHYAASLTTYITPRHAGPQKDTTRQEESSRSDALVSHWKPHLSITVLSTDFTFNKAGLPSDLRRHMRVSSTRQLPLTVSYQGTSLQTFRFWVHLQDLVYSLRQFGFTEENIDEIKETLCGSNLYLLILTALVTALHLICEFLALKNDITSWRKKKSMVGMSRRSVVWRCLSTLLVFLHLLEDTSLLVLLPVGLGVCVEVWKVFKVFKVHVHLKSYRSFMHGTNTLLLDLCSSVSLLSSSGPFSSSHQLSCFRDELFFLLYLYQRRHYANKARVREVGTQSKKLKTQ
ncbi:unnamed protein product [Merluccius merluccius]